MRRGLPALFHVPLCTNVLDWRGAGISRPRILASAMLLMHKVKSPWDWSNTPRTAILREDFQNSLPGQIRMRHEWLINVLPNHSLAKHARLGLDICVFTSSYRPVLPPSNFQSLRYSKPIPPAYLSCRKTSTPAPGVGTSFESSTIQCGQPKRQITCSTTPSATSRWSTRLMSLRIALLEHV